MSADLRLVVDNTKRRRQVAAPQANIARTARVARSLGPEWQVLIEGNVVRLFQGPAPIAIVEAGIARGPAFVP
jgi:hypothetical protein